MRNKCISCGKSIPELKCDNCNKRFKDKNSLSKHKQKKYPCKEIKYKYENECQECGRVLDEFTCDICEYAFKHACRLKRHQNRKTSCIKERKRYICECSKELSCYFSWYKHKQKSCNLRNQLNN